MNGISSNFRAGTFLAVSTFALSACFSKSIDTTIIKQPTSGVKVDEVTVQRFAANRSHVAQAATLAEMVIAGIGSHQFVTVKPNARYQLQGQIDVAKWSLEKETKDAYKIKKLKPVKDGTKCVVTKKGALTGTYNLMENGTSAGGGTFNIPITDKGSDKSCSGARSELKSETELLHSAMQVASQQIVAAVSPHTVTQKIDLIKGGSKDNKLGIDFFKDGLPDQAIGIWTQVIEGDSSSEARTAAYHNIGVAYEAQGDLKTAFDNYAEASSLNPSERKHRKALKRVQDKQTGIDVAKTY